MESEDNQLRRSGSSTRFSRRQHFARLPFGRPEIEERYTVLYTCAGQTAGGGSKRVSGPAIMQAHRQSRKLEIER